MTVAELVARARLAMAFDEFDYAIAACQEVLRHCPQHIEARCLLGQAHLEQGRTADAGASFEAVLAIDPENVLARAGLAVVLERQGQLRRAIAELQRAYECSPGHTEVREALLSLRSQLERTPPNLEVGPAAEGRIRLRRGEADLAVRALDAARQQLPDRLDVRLAHAEALWQSGRRSTATAECRAILEKSPQTLKAKALLALLLLEGGQHAEGAELLHQCCLADPSHTVAARLFVDSGVRLPDYAAAIAVDEPALPVSAQLAIAARSVEDSTRRAGVLTAKDADTALEDLPLPPPAPPAPRTSPTAELAASLSAAVRRSPREPRPAGGYIILTSATNLRAKYGDRAFGAIERRLKSLAATLGDAGYDARLLFVDDAPTMRAAGVEAVAVVTADAVKSLLDRLDVRLAERGTPLRHVLIVGGGDIVPFHHLANPTDDDDVVVPSDAGYACSGVGFFHPSRAVGRLPDGAGGPGLLLALADAIVNRMQAPPSASSWFGLPWWRRNGSRRELGYTALVWRAATEAVYSEIADAKGLQSSPPSTARSLDADWLDGKRFLLFNLHGTPGSAHWYGQKDASYPADYPLFPVALSPDNLADAELDGAIVFTEACHGANFDGKLPADSLALEFLRRGAACVIGSTAIAYGSGEPPLSGADLLASFFWRELAAGATAGEALARAKTTFVGTVHRRQGYLDGDDQKTVYSFLLLGDPAARLTGALPKAADAEPAEEPLVAPTLYCKTRSMMAGRAQLSGDLMAHLRRRLLRIAPEALDEAPLVLPRAICDRCTGACGGESCLVGDEKTARPSAYVVTYHKAPSSPDGAPLARTARITVDERGDILKVSVSK